MMPELADVTMLLLLVGCFALVLAYARLCARVLGPPAGKDIPL
jgi:hypothetical protein